MCNATIRSLNEDMEDPVLSHLLLADECLLDARRVNIFERAIKESVNPHSVVVDAGTGTGIMAMIAARAGAKKVYALEIDSGIAEMARDSIKKAGYKDVITVLNCNVKDFSLPNNKSADVLNMELLDTGLISEHQTTAILALKKNRVIDDHTILIPHRVTSSVRLIFYDFNFYGFEFPIIIQARNFKATKNIQNIMSNFVIYSDVDLRNINTQEVKSKIEIPVDSDGEINACELTTDVYLSNRRYAATTDMNMPVIIPTKLLKVKKGDIIEININYQMSKGFETFSLLTCKKDK